MKNRDTSAHENTSQNKTKIGTTLIMASTVIMVFRVEGTAQVLQHISEKGKQGQLRCTVCDKDFAISSRERCILHVLSKSHQDKCKQKLRAKDTAASQNLLQQASASVISGDKLCNLIKDYASQYCVAKSLPFTAATMALDCVCAAFSTVVKGEISEAAINALDKKGHKFEVCISC